MIPPSLFCQSSYDAYVSMVITVLDSQVSTWTTFPGLRSASEFQRESALVSLVREMSTPLSLPPLFNYSLTTTGLWHGLAEAP